jgi:hypothetical protein
MLRRWKLNKTDSESCPLTSFGISGVESAGSATTVSVRWILGRWVVRMGGGSNWLRIVSNGRLWYLRC